MTVSHVSHAGCCGGAGGEDVTVRLDGGMVLRLSGTRVMVVGHRDMLYDLSDEQLFQAMGLLALAAARRGWGCPSA